MDRATATRYSGATKGRSRALRALRGTTSSGRGPWYLLHLVAARFARSIAPAPLNIKTGSYKSRYALCLLDTPTPKYVPPLNSIWDS